VFLRCSKTNLSIFSLFLFEVCNKSLQNVVSTKRVSRNDSISTDLPKRSSFILLTSLRTFTLLFNFRQQIFLGRMTPLWISRNEAKPASTPLPCEKHQAREKADRTKSYSNKISNTAFHANSKNYSYRQHNYINFHYLTWWEETTLWVFEETAARQCSHPSLDHEYPI